MTAGRRGPTPRSFPAARVHPRIEADRRPGAARAFPNAGVRRQCRFERGSHPPSTCAERRTVPSVDAGHAAIAAAGHRWTVRSPSARSVHICWPSPDHSTSREIPRRPCTRRAGWRSSRALVRGAVDNPVDRTLAHDRCGKSRQACLGHAGQIAWRRRDRNPGRVAPTAAPPTSPASGPGAGCGGRGTPRSASCPGQSAPSRLRCRRAASPECPPWCARTRSKRRRP